MGFGQLRQHLESLAAAGVRDLPRGVATVSPPAVVADSVSASPPTDAESLGGPPAPEPGTSDFLPLRQLAADALASRQAALNAVRAEVAGCTRCGELARCRTQTVFGSGHAATRICFLGEAPGADEDASGEPFVGRAGQLLTKIIEACRLKRDEVFILNVLKCRPPGNRRPLPEEVENCRPFFQRQLEILTPELICCLGATAAQALLGTNASIGALRGRWHQYGEVPVLCTYHPSYLLRNPAAKRDVWDDMKTMMRQLGVEL